MKRRTATVALAAVASLLLLGGRSWASAPTEKVRSMLERVMSIQTDPKLQGEAAREERKRDIGKVISESFRFDSMAEQTLGDSWQKLSPEEQEEFTSVFRDLFQDSYTRLVLDFLGRENVVYGDEALGEKQASVKTTIVRPNESIPVDYSLVSTDRGWLVEDVKIDGVSIVENYRKSFHRVIAADSYAGLLRRMRLQQKAIRKP